MEQYDSFLAIIVVAIAYTTYKGLNDRDYQNKHIFHPDSILHHKQWHRMLTSGFIHGSWMHFAFNAFALFSFGTWMAAVLGPVNFSLMFLGSIFAGSTLSLFIHRNNPHYLALGASGGVFGLVFASIVYSPNSSLQFIFIPVDIPSWLMGIGLVGVSIYGIKNSFGNIGHDAHLGGAIFGVIMTGILEPWTLEANWWAYALVGIPSIVFIGYLIKNPNS